MDVRVAAAGRLHFGFCNLSLAHDRLYGGIGAAIEGPRTVVRARPAAALECSDPDARRVARWALVGLGADGATIEVEERLPPHVGLGSGTQLALAVYLAIARTHGLEADPRGQAPALDRGGRSGVGVAVFERGGFVVDAGHPAERFTTERPARGTWTVPPVAARHRIPDDWRFVVVLPDVEPGPSGDREDDHMRAVIDRAAPGIADEIGAIVARRLLPAIATGDRVDFGRAVGEIGRLNGVWFAEEQGGVYRPPIGAIVDALGDSPSVSGAGQSSWGPTVYGVTDVGAADRAAVAAREALDAVGVDGEVRVVAGRNDGVAASVGAAEPGGRKR